MAQASWTTASLLTPPGRGGIAVILLYGPRAEEIAARAFRPRQSHRDSPAAALQLGHVVSGDLVVDEAVVCRRGLTAEINIHGGPVVAEQTMKLLAALGARIIMPGGIDGIGGVSAGSEVACGLPEAHPRWNNPAVGREMLTALPDARGELVLAAISRQWSAGLSELARGILDTGAGGVSTGPGCGRRVDGAESSADAYDPRGLGPCAAAERLRACGGSLGAMQRLLAPCEIVLAGPPNAGKSTLANTLIGRPASIVNPMPGTTRDWVREPALLDGVPVWLTDTAGIWSPAADGIDAEAVRRARDRLRQADVVVLLEREGATESVDWRPEGTQKVIHVAAKCDLHRPRRDGLLAVSAHTGEGLPRLRAAICRALGFDGFDPRRPMAFTARQAGLLSIAAHAMETGDSTTAGRSLHELLEQRR